MRTISISALSKAILAAFILVLFSFLTCPGQTTQDEPLGDVARENRTADENQKTAPAKKVYRNSSISSPAETGTDSAQPETSATSANAPTPQSDAATVSGEAEKPPSNTTSVVDRSKKRHDRSDFFIVPAFTEIRVEVEPREGAAPSSAVEVGKVVLPVRVGFSDAIPVFSKVKFGYAGTGDTGTFYELTSVKVGKITYKVHTDAVPYSPEMRFTLSKPLWIKR
ncbi:MAG TPA: hypothetical protein VGG46_06450 [Terriglobales bacterium]|jgi:hypothetical protein